MGRKLTPIKSLYGYTIEDLKKTSDLLPTVESSSDCVLYAMDETSLRAEYDNRRTWSQVGVSLVLEHNGSHKGVNIIGDIELTKTLTLS